MEPRVALVSMPWTDLTQPSLGLGILKAQLTSEGMAARVFHANVRLLRYMTAPAYQHIAICWALNEFAFTGVLDPTTSRAQVETLKARSRFHSAPTMATPF